MPDLFGLAAIITKFLLYLGVITAAGTVMAALVFKLDRTRGLAATFAALGLFATILSFSLRGANLTGDVSGMTDPMMLNLLWSTPVGTALALRLVGLSLLLVGLFLGRIGAWASVLGGLIALFSFTQIGHISGSEAAFMEVTLMLHLLAIALWIGVLTPLNRLASIIHHICICSGCRASIWPCCIRYRSRVDRRGWLHGLPTCRVVHCTCRNWLRAGFNH